MGFYITGYFIGMETREFKNDDGSIAVRHSINVATGNLAYRVYMADSFDPASCSNMKIGQEVCISCRVYCGKNAKLTVVDGQLEKL